MAGTTSPNGLGEGISDSYFILLQSDFSLERNHPVNAVRPENAELALVVTTKVNEAAATLAGARQGYLVDGPNAELVLVLEQDQGLTRHRSREAKVRELDDLAGDPLAGGRKGGLGLRIHFTIEAEAMYPLK
jgi:hypothetical protein